MQYITWYLIVFAVNNTKTNKFEKKVKYVLQSTLSFRGRVA